MNTPQKPIVVIQKEFQNMLVGDINNFIQQYQPPFFILEPVIKDLYTEITEKAKIEYQQAKTQYMTAVTEYQQAQAKNTEEPKSEN